MADRRRPEASLSPPALYARGLERATTALKSGQWAYGPRAKEVESLIAERLELPPDNVIATASATAALHAASCFMGMHLEPHCYNVCPLTWPSTYLSITRVNDMGETMEPQWIDCGTVPTSVQHMVDVSCDLWGMPGPAKSMAGRVHDAAHRALAPEHVDRLKEEQNIVYSFAPQKEIPSPGGGALVCRYTDNANYARELLRCSTHGRAWNGDPDGQQGLMNEISAALVREGIHKHDERRKRRQEVLYHYNQHLGGILLTQPPGASGHLAIAAAPSKVVRDHWRRVLTGAGIAWGHHYPLNDRQRAACPDAAEWSDRIITLPCHLGMDQAAVRRVCMRLLTA